MVASTGENVDRTEKELAKHIIQVIEEHGRMGGLAAIWRTYFSTQHPDASPLPPPTHSSPSDPPATPHTGSAVTGVQSRSGPGTPLKRVTEASIPLSPETQRAAKRRKQGLSPTAARPGSSDASIESSIRHSQQAGISDERFQQIFYHACFADVDAFLTPRPPTPPPPPPNQEETPTLKSAEPPQWTAADFLEVDRAWVRSLVAQYTATVLSDAAETPGPATTVTEEPPVPEAVKPADVFVPRTTRSSSLRRPRGPVAVQTPQTTPSTTPKRQTRTRKPRSSLQTSSTPGQQTSSTAVPVAAGHAVGPSGPSAGIANGVESTPSTVTRSDTTGGHLQMLVDAAEQMERTSTAGMP